MVAKAGAVIAGVALVVSVCALQADSAIPYASTFVCLGYLLAYLIAKWDTLIREYDDVDELLRSERKRGQHVDR